MSPRTWAHPTVYKSLFLRDREKETTYMELVIDYQSRS